MLKKGQIFRFAYGQGREAPPPSYSQPDRKKPVLVFDDFPFLIANFPPSKILVGVLNIYTGGVDLLREKQT